MERRRAIDRLPLDSIAIIFIYLYPLALYCGVFVPRPVQAESEYSCQGSCQSAEFQRSAAAGRCNPIEPHETNFTTCLCSDKDFLQTYAQCLWGQCPAPTIQTLLQEMNESCSIELNAKVAVTYEELYNLIYPIRFFILPLLLSYLLRIQYDAK